MSNNAKNLPEVKLGQYKGLAVTRHVHADFMPPACYDHGLFPSIHPGRLLLPYTP